MSNLAKVANSSISNEWCTPDKLFQVLNKEFNFTWDLACSIANKKCANGLTNPEMNSLKIDWHKLAKDSWLWLNPPYSPLRPWIEKTQKEASLGAKVVMLIPPQSPARYFTNFLPSNIRYITGRISFEMNGIPVRSNTRDSAIYIYDGTIEQSKRIITEFIDRNILLCE